MPNPEFAIRVSLPENKNLIRQAAGKGVEAIKPETALILLTDGSLNWMLQQHARLSKDPELYEFIPRIKLRKRNQGEAEVPSKSPIA